MVIIYPSTRCNISEGWIFSKAAVRNSYLLSSYFRLYESDQNYVMLQPSGSQSVLRGY